MWEIRLMLNGPLLLGLSGSVSSHLKRISPSDFALAASFSFNSEVSFDGMFPSRLASSANATELPKILELKIPTNTNFFKFIFSLLSYLSTLT